MYTPYTMLCSNYISIKLGNNPLKSNNFLKTKLGWVHSTAAGHVHQLCFLQSKTWEAHAVAATWGRFAVDKNQHCLMWSWNPPASINIRQIHFNTPHQFTQSHNFLLIPHKNHKDTLGQSSTLSRFLFGLCLEIPIQSPSGCSRIGKFPAPFLSFLSPPNKPWVEEEWMVSGTVIQRSRLGWATSWARESVSLGSQKHFFFYFLTLPGGKKEITSSMIAFTYILLPKENWYSWASPDS